jgi:hypothetical protein
VGAEVANHIRKDICREGIRSCHTAPYEIMLIFTF